MATLFHTDARDAQTAGAGYDISRIRANFPILTREVNGKPLAYLDNAATSQTPETVVDAIVRYYREYNSNVHRGVHRLSQEATTAFEAARHTCAAFIGAGVDCEIVFTRGATEALNLIANTYGEANVGPDDEIVISAMEHHANIVPWQMLCQRKGAHLRVVPIDDEGVLQLDALDSLLSPRTKIVSLCHTSNVLGTVNPIAEIAERAHAVGAVMIVDGAQATPHAPVDVRALSCDFFVTSGHKMYGPTGIGFLYGRAPLLDKMPPWQGGGDMIRSVSFEGTTYNRSPYRFEAGTPHIEGAIALAAAIDYLNAIGLDTIAAHEHDLLEYTNQHIAEVPGVHLIGRAPGKAAVVSFTMDSAHPHDIGQILDAEGVAVRAGHHCAQPLMQRFGLPATARASFGLYNTREEIDRFIAALHRVNEIFGA